MIITFDVSIHDVTNNSLNVLTFGKRALMSKPLGGVEFNYDCEETFAKLCRIFDFADVTRVGKSCAILRLKEAPTKEVTLADFLELISPKPFAIFDRYADRTTPFLSGHGKTNEEGIEDFKTTTNYYLYANRVIEKVNSVNVVHDRWAITLSFKEDIQDA